MISLVLILNKYITYIYINIYKFKYTYIFIKKVLVIWDRNEILFLK